MKTCYYYWLIEPVRDSFEDSWEREPIFNISIQHDDSEYDLSIFVDANGLPEYGRLRIPGLMLDRIPESLLPILQATREHLRSILRLTYHSEASIFHAPVWTFVDEGAQHRIGLDFEKFATDLTFDAERAKRLFVASFRFREEIRLLIEGHDGDLPLQYRFLSLYKLLEVCYRFKGKWKVGELGRLLDSYKSEFIRLGIQRMPNNYVHELRDKCAHIKGKSTEAFGVTHLNRKEALEVSNFLPVMQSICIDALRERTNGEIEIRKIPKGLSPSLSSAMKSA